jgi:hypothetical protein
MSRLLLAATFGLLLGGHAYAQCGKWYRPFPGPVYVPTYPYGPSVWGAPSPATLPPSRPFVPKKGVGLKEEVEPPPSPTIDRKSKESEPSKTEAPKIPKLKLPLPGDSDFPDVPTPKPKKEPLTDKGKSVEQYVVPADEKQSKPGPQVRVGFFNHSEREILLEVNGEQHKLPSEQYVTMRLPRTFTWAEKGQKGKEVVVPPDADGIEIVFRK